MNTEKLAQWRTRAEGMRQDAWIESNGRQAGTAKYDYLNNHIKALSRDGIHTDVFILREDRLPETLLFLGDLRLLKGQALKDYFQLKAKEPKAAAA